MALWFGDVVSSAAEPGAELFTNVCVRQLEIEIPVDGIKSLRSEPRKFVRATVRENTNTFSDVALHLKGALGSFRPIDDKPAMTLDFSRFSPGQKFHGLRRIHLNNSVEDPSCLNEQLGGELFRLANVPAPRVARAHVTLNSRPLGLFVLKEGFTEDFLAGSFHRVGGNLYEPKNGGDVDGGLKRNSVEAPRNSKDDLRKLAATLACDPGQRWAKLEQLVDMERFIPFMIMEVILCHRDGYCFARNNFRVYHDLDSGKLIFLPHGMDQLLGKADLPWEPVMAGNLARAVMETPEGRARYEEQFPVLLDRCFCVQNLANRVNQLMAQMRPCLTQGEWAAVQEEGALINQRIVSRRMDLEKQLSAPRPKLLVFKEGTAPLGDWVDVDQPSGGRMDRVTVDDGIATLHIVAGAESSASWRTRVLLQPGHYQFEGRCRIGGFKPLPYGLHQGAALRIGSRDRPANDLMTNSTWQTLSTDFQVDAQIEPLELVCEFRATAGEAWFDVKSLQVKCVK